MVTEPRARASTASRLIFALLLAPALLWLLGLIVLPHVELAVLSLRQRVGPGQYEFGWRQYLTFVEEPLYWHTFVRTAAISILATACTLLLAFPIAWTIAKIARGRTRSVMFMLCLIPFWVSETVRTLGWMILLRESGVLPAWLVKLGLAAAPPELLYRDATVLVGLVYGCLLFMVVPLVSALDTLDDAWVEAAYNLGGNGLSILRRIVIPHAAPGIAAGCIFVFVPSLGNFIVPDLLGGGKTSMVGNLIQQQFLKARDWPFGATLSLFLIGLMGVVLFIQAWLLARERRETAGG